MSSGPGKTKVVYQTPEESSENVGYFFTGGVTRIDRDTGDAEIIIDSTLSPKLQEAYLQHETAQLEVILQEAPRYGDSILPKAHQIGLEAGYKKARSLGIEEEYRNHRGERE